LELSILMRKSLVRKALFGAVAAAAAVTAWAGPSAAAVSRARAVPAAVSPATDPTQTNYSFGVLVLKYFPLTSDGQNIDVNVTGDVSGSLASLRAKTDSITANLAAALAKATEYHGYANPAATPSYAYHVVDTREIDTAVPTVSNPFFSPPSNPYAVRPAYPQIMNSANICDYVDNLGVSEVWMYAYQGPSQLQIDESKMSGPNGDVSNEWTHDALPVCSKTYTLYTFNYGRGTAEAFHSHAHQYEAELGYVDNQEYSDSANLFRNLFEGTPYPQTAGVTGRCGSVHNPPNARQEYDWANPAPQASDCENWNPDSPGATTPISCTTWDLNNPTCTDISDTDNSQLNYIIWWEQNFPGKGNTVSYKGQPFRNWWDVHGEWDTIVSQHLGLTLPAPAGTAKYSFEDGTLSGWGSDGNVTSLASSSDVPGQDGTHELKAVFHSTGSGDFPTLHASPASTSRPAAGQTLSAWLYIPSATTTTVTAKLFYQDPSTFKWITGPNTVITQRGAWVKLSLPVTGISAPSHQIGIQLQESPFNTDSTIYVDSVNWG
jgi:hypothetical protein